ncbi:unnamed protein product [Lactuca virosa]|uniref:Uncharacterized protein n=1 Tax=Lactuca virosa TaxID=75947 RepID=A0AAU9PIG6_9ASTR|nr:unnamed protein product [Lactuca virosa]
MLDSGTGLNAIPDSVSIAVYHILKHRSYNPVVRSRNTLSIIVFNLRSSRVDLMEANISSSSKGTSSVKIVKVNKDSKVIKIPNEDDDFVSALVAGQVNVKKAEIVYRSKSFVDISSSSKGTSSVKIVKVNKDSKVIKIPNEDDDFVSAPVVGQVNVKKAEIVYRYPPDKLKEAFSDAGYEKVEVIQTYEDFVDDAIDKDSKTEIDEEHISLANVLRRRMEKKKMKENEENKYVVMKKKTHKKKMRKNIHLKKMNKSSKQKFEAQQVEGINIVHKKSIENEVSFVLDFANKGKKVVEDNINENQKVEVSKDFSNVEKQSEDVPLCQELRDVQLDQLSMTQILDHPRVQEQLEVLMNSNEVLEDRSIEPSKILSDLVVSNQFHDPDAII